MDVLWQAKVLVQEIVLVLIIAWAFWRGALPERAVAIAFCAIWGFDRCYHLTLPLGWFWDGIDLGHMLIDIFGLLLLSAIALRVNRLYPICLAALQLFTLIVHVARGMMPDVELGAYGILIVAPSYLLIVVFALGLILHRRRLRKYGPYQSWSNSSGHS